MLCIICHLRVQLIPWPCNMWQLLPRRSRRNRGRHRLTLRVVTVPITTFSRLLAAGPSTRSGDPGQLIPGFILREKAPLLALCFCKSQSLSALRTNEKKCEWVAEVLVAGAGFSSALPGVKLSLLTNSQLSLRN